MSLNIKPKGGCQVNNFQTLVHDDHGLQPEHADLIQASEEIASKNAGDFVIIVLPLPDGVESLPCALYGPAVGDDPVSGEQVTFEVRGGRDGPSRLVDKPCRPARNVVVIGIKGGVCFTAYGSRAEEPAPMEPWDAERKHASGDISADELLKSRQFWAVHALAKGGEL